MSNQNRLWVSLDEIVELAKTEPNTDIWCVKSDFTHDFILSAGSIASSSAEEMDWSDYTFAVIKKEANNMPDKKEEKKEEPQTIKLSEKPKEATISVSHWDVKIKVIESTDIHILEQKVNEFMKGKDVRNVEYNVSNSGVYSVFIAYAEEV